MRYPLLLVAAVALLCGDLSAQLLRRAEPIYQATYPTIVIQGPVCPGPQCSGPQCNTCPQPTLAAPQPIVQAKTQETESITEVSTARARTPHVRCLFNGSCGSGTICGADKIGAYVLTNAHVVGTAIGRVCSVDVVTASGTVRIRGRIIMAGYSDRTMVDFSVLHCEGLTSDRYMPLLRTEPTMPPYATTGSPRCVWPQVTKQFNDPRNYGQGLITGSPDAIGGQSGSAIFNSKGQQIALLTWSIGGRCAGQKTSKLWQVASQRNVDIADQRIPGMTEVQLLDDLTDTQPTYDPANRPVTESGIHGAIAAFSTADVIPYSGPRIAANQQPSSIAKIGKLEVGVQNVVGSAMQDLPIWYDPAKPEPDPAPEPQPQPPVQDPDCYKLTAKEWELIQFLRKQAEQDGEVADRDWLALFLRVMPIIMELIKALQQTR